MGKVSTPNRGKVTSALAFSIATWAFTAATSAQTDFWTNPAGGTFSNESNWSLNQIPNGNDVTFATGSNSPYTVTTPLGISVGTLTVQNNSVVLDTTGTASGEYVNADLNVNSSAGQTADLTIIGVLDVWFGSINVSGQGISSLTAGSIEITGTATDPVQNLYCGPGSNVTTTLNGGDGLHVTVAGTANLSFDLQGASVNVGGPGVAGAILNGTTGGDDGSASGVLQIGINGAGTYNGNIGLAYNSVEVGVDSIGILNLHSVGNSALFGLYLGTLGVVNLSGGATFVGSDFRDYQCVVSNAGSIAISPGCLLQAPMYDQFAGGSLSLSLESSGVEVVVGTSTVLAGTLYVTNPSALPLTQGETFDLFSLSGETGKFSTITLPPLPGGLSWDTSHLYTTGFITVVPEPAIGMLAAATVAALWRRKRGMCCGRHRRDADFTFA